MMNGFRIALFGATGFAATLALGLAGVDWLDTGIARRPATVEPLSSQRLPLAMPGDGITRVPVDESLQRDLMLKADVNRVRVSDARNVALKAVTALAEAPGEHADSALAEVALSHGESEVRDEAVHALGQRGGTIALQTLQQALQDPTKRVREAAVRALADVRGDEAVRILGSALNAGDASLRVNAADALGEIGGPEATRYLEQVLGDENEVVREAAAEWLTELPAGAEHVANVPMSLAADGVSAADLDEVVRPPPR
jgi:HEAT repeat protein